MAAGNCGGDEGSMRAWYVLVGGEAYESQGVPDLTSRELLHTSLSFIGTAYDSLRAAGVPRERIITIVQCKDYLQSPHLLQNDFVRQSVETACQLLIDEGGSTYDFAQVNPSTVWNVLLGNTTALTPIVVPQESTGAIMLAIYSHGDSHPSSTVGHTAQKKATADARRQHSLAPWGPAVVAEKQDYLQHEWYCHMPYPSPREEAASMTEFVAIETARRPDCYLYATQLRLLFAKLFLRQPTRPVLVLLNYCRAGGALEFMRRDWSRRMLGADQWPLFLAASSQAEHDALVCGLWKPFFECLCVHVKNSTRAASLLENGDVTIQTLFDDAVRQYYSENVYELSDHVTTHAFPESKLSSFRSDLNRLLIGGENGTPDFDGLREMHISYRDGSRFDGRKVIIWDPSFWEEQEADLVEAVIEAQRRSAIPECAFGGLGIEQKSVRLLFGETLVRKKRPARRQRQ